MLARTARVAALLVAWCAALPALARAGAPPEPRRVLILNSYHPGFQWTDGETSGVLAALGGSPKDMQVYVEYMGSKWASSPKYFRELRDAYATKFRDVPFDAIVATDDDALRFLVDYREAVFGEVPTVFCGVNDFDPAQLHGRGLYTGVNEVFDVRRSLDLALRLHPATRRIAVVSDSSISGRKIRDQFARGAREYAPRLAFEYLGERPLEEVLDRVAHLPSDSLVFHLVYFSDWRGKVMDNEETAALVSRASRVPVYGGWEFSLGHGIVGGRRSTSRSRRRARGRCTPSPSPDQRPSLLASGKCSGCGGRVGARHQDGPGHAQHPLLATAARAGSARARRGSAPGVSAVRGMGRYPLRLRCRLWPLQLRRRGRHGALSHRAGGAHECREARRGLARGRASRVEVGRSLAPGRG